MTTTPTSRRPLFVSTPLNAIAQPATPSPQSPNVPLFSLQPSKKRELSTSKKVMRRFRSVFRSFPIIVPTCKIPVSLNGTRLHEGHIHGTRITGTIFGYRKARVNLVIQENPRVLPLLVLELAIPTGKFLQDMGSGMVRIALETEKKQNDKTKIIDEPIWTMYCNGRKSGYGVKREPTEEDLGFMQTLHAVSMGAGVLPTDGNEHPDGELAYMRAQFERVVGSKDSETYYMQCPDGNISGPELSIFFVRI
ncbi:protein MIZU-KUSSEI 1 [Pistacia vera]|uniref:protein MIZU-KUSSEI 1 n=1 Tax=Pistacia vera TaxID=55513 RepID=UPI001263116D|nr:protein MIZU-KUSSEI 1 [Pistacia vera]